MIERLIMFVYRNAYLLWLMPIGINLNWHNDWWRYPTAAFLLIACIRFSVIMNFATRMPTVMRLAKRPMCMMDILAHYNPQSIFTMSLVADAIEVSLNVMRFFQAVTVNKDSHGIEYYTLSEE